MSDSKASATASITTSDGTVMTKGDVEFLITCIQNTAGGSLVVDQAKVAAALGMKNVKSVANKVGMIKKKYSLPLSTSSKAASADATSPGPAVPKTTAKVIKKGTAKKVPVKKGGKKGAKKEESEGEAEQEPEQETEQHAESGAEGPDVTVSTSLTVKKLSTPELEDLCFGPADPEEDDDETQNV